jgi:hypothetical protein
MTNLENFRELNQCGDSSEPCRELWTNGSMLSLERCASYFRAAKPRRAARRLQRCVGLHPRPAATRGGRLSGFRDTLLLDV